jgi:sigma-B regulation protein RsbU (phosphoserine phosphatase)
MSAEIVKTILYFLSGGFLIFLAITITRDSFSSRLNRVTGAMLGLAGLGPIFMALGMVISQSATVPINFEDSTLYSFYHLWEFFFPFLLVFSWIYPIDRFRNFRHKRLLYIVFIPQVIHLIVVLFFGNLTQILAALEIGAGEEGVSTLILGPLSRLLSWLLLLVSYVRTNHAAVFGIVNLLYVFTAIYFLESGRRYLSNPRLLSQTKVVLWGTRIGLGLFVIARLGSTILPYRFSENVTNSLLIAALLCGAGIFIFATIRYQFLDVRLIFRQSFVYTITSALLVAVYILLVVQSKQFFSPIFGEQAELVSYAFIIILLLLFQPINNWIDNAIRSMFLRTRSDHRNIIERFSRQVISQFDPAHLRQIIEETLKTFLLVDRVHFVLFNDTINEYATVPSDEYPRQVVIERSDMMLRGINLLDNPTQIRALHDYRENSELARILDERRVRLILPMKDAKHLLGFLALTDKITGYRYSSDDLNLLGVLSNQMVTALTNARLYVESLERIRLQEEVSMARQIQLDLLPSEPPKLTCSEISALSTPSRTVGGDFYDFIELDNGCIGVVIADASGKGMPAALMIAQIQAIIRSEVTNGNSIPTMLKHLNQQVVTTTSSEKYATLFYGELHPDTGEFHYSNAGHNYPILIRGDGSMELLQVGGLVVGALPHMEYQSAKTVLGSDDILFLFTDGLSEAMDDQEQEYTEDRIREFVHSHRNEDACDLMAHILEDVLAFDPTDPPRDDTTIVAIKMNDALEYHG